MELGQSYHIYNHANGMDNIFREEENYRFFLQQYQKCLGEVVDTCYYLFQSFKTLEKVFTR
jgi:putative transposase